MAINHEHFYASMKWELDFVEFLAQVSYVQF